MCSLVEKHADALVRELIAKTVFVRVVHPFGHPQEGQRSGQARRVSVCCRDEDNRWMVLANSFKGVNGKGSILHFTKKAF